MKKFILLSATASTSTQNYLMGLLIGISILIIIVVVFQLIEKIYEEKTKCGKKLLEEKSRWDMTLLEKEFRLKKEQTERELKVLETKERVLKLEKGKGVKAGNIPLLFFIYSLCMSYDSNLSEERKTNPHPVCGTAHLPCGTSLYAPLLGIKNCKKSPIIKTCFFINNMYTIKL